MSFPTVFSNLAGGVQPASLLDTMFNIVGGQGVIPTTAVGTNTIALTPRTNFYQPAAYAANQGVAFVTAGASTGSVTVQLGGLPVVKLFMPSGLQAGSGDLGSGALVVAFFVPTLDSGNGGFQVMNSTTPSVVQGIPGAVKNLTISIANDTQIGVNCDNIIVQNFSAGSLRIGAVGVTINTGTSGANGLDSGSVAASTFYSVWVIFNSNTSTIAGLISTNATTPVLPAGFTYLARVGWVRTDGSVHLLRTFQKGRRAQYVVSGGGSNVPNLPIMASGAQAAWTSVSTTTFVPSTASEIFLVASLLSSVGAAEQAFAAPNSSYNTGPSTANPVPVYCNSPVVAGQQYSNAGSFVLEGSTIQVGIGLGGGGAGSIACQGWVDNL